MWLRNDEAKKVEVHMEPAEGFDGDTMIGVCFSSVSPYHRYGEWPACAAILLHQDHQTATDRRCDDGNAVQREMVEVLSSIFTELSNVHENINIYAKKE